MDNSKMPGLAGVAVVSLGLVGAALWLGLLLGPWRLASGMLEAGRRLDRTENHLSNGNSRKARVEAMSAVAAADRARAGLTGGGPLFDVARALPQAADALEEVPHLVAALEHSARAALGTVALAEGSLKGPDRLIAPDPDDPDGGSMIRIERVEALGGEVRDIRRELAAARDELEEVDTGNLPGRGSQAVRDGIARAAQAGRILKDAQAGFDILPAILGRDEPRTYLLGFQNTAEQRGTGGAILQFSQMTIDEGRVEIDEKASSVYNVDANRKQISIPLPDDAWHVAQIPDAQRFGNANWSPDWPLSAQLTIDYAKATPGIDFPDVDGVINVDPLAIQKLMPGTGPFTTKSQNRISASRVVHFLLYKAYASYPIKGVRRVVLNQVVDGFVKRMFDPNRPTALATGLGSALAQKHMQIWMKEPAEQAFIERMKWDGAIKEAKGSDYVYVVEQNVGGNKLDYFDTNTTTMDIRIEERDAITSTEMRVHNGVFLPQPRYSMGDTQSRRACSSTVCPTHRPMLNLYVQGDAELLGWEIGAGVTRIDSPAPAAWNGDIPATHMERGKRVWSGTLQIPPATEGTLRFDYRVPSVVRTKDGRSVYRLQVQHQPKVRPENMIVRLSLPDGASDVRAKGWTRDGDTLVWERPLKEDLVLEVSWQE